MQLHFSVCVCIGPSSDTFGFPQRDAQAEKMVGLVLVFYFLPFYFHYHDLCCFSTSVPNKTGCIEDNQENGRGEQGHQRAVTHLEAAESKQMRFDHCLQLKGQFSPK